MCAVNLFAKREALQRAVDEAYDAGLMGKNAAAQAGITIFTCITAPALISAAKKPR
jgi:NADH:ubiquinone oxidoreductase subunit F (NADH-binding)